MKNVSGNIFAYLKYWKQRIFNSNRYILTKNVCKYLNSEDCKLPIEEKARLKKNLSNFLVTQISYPFIKDYHYRPVKVFWDKSKYLHYVLHNKKKMYFKKDLSKSKIREMYNDLCIEQDIRSPHSYSAFSIIYRSTDIAVDIGASEGIWALDIVEKVQKIYLLECEENWIKALQATFEPWKNKVCIVKKFVSDFTDEVNITLDDYFCKDGIFPTIIKADIEGAEISCIRGASELLTQHIRHVLLCTYHNIDDFATLADMMKNHNFEVQPSKGYIIAIYSEPDYGCKDITKLFRKGVIHAYKHYIS